MLIVKPKNLYRYFLLVLFTFFSILSATSQTETFSSGTYIINMGVTPQTVGNALKPYGLVYDLIRNYRVPVKWVISQSKVKDGTDFVYNGVQYKGGTFIIPAEFRDATVNARIAYWQSQGVVGTTTVSPLTVDVTYKMISAPRWTLDAQNGAIAQVFLTNAGITNTAFPGAYNWKAPALLDCCDDFFVMPHADPTWATHGRLLSWNKDCLGGLWLGCHAGSALENMVNPADRTQQTNFLTKKDPALTGTTGSYASSNSLILWGSHSGGSIPYAHRLPNDPNAQYLGTTDAAQLNGSEQIYIPNQTSALTGWNPGTKIIAYDPTQLNVPSLKPDLSNAAALIAYGRGFDDPARGYVMYEAAHNIANGTGAANIAAQRVFLNFSFFQILPKAPQLSDVSGLTNGQLIQGGNSVSLSISASSPLAGIVYTYQWTADCAGTFSNPNGASTTFTPAVPGSVTPCSVTCLVSDQCGRKSFQKVPVVVVPPPAAPIAANDFGTIAGGCTPGTNISLNVLRNDSDPQGSELTITSLNQGAASPVNAGVWALSPDSSISFTPDPNFNGTATITYTITNPFGGTASATVSITVGTTDGDGCTSNQVYAPQEVNLITLADFVSQSGTGAALNGTALDDNEGTYTTAAADYLNFGTNAANNLILSVGSTSPLRAKDSINIYWSKGANGTGTISVQIGQSSTGPWTNLQTFTNTVSGTGASVSKISTYVLPAGTSGITHVRLSPGIASPAANSAVAVWVDAVEYEYLSCISRQPDLQNDAMTVLEDAPAILNVLANDQDPQDLTLTVKNIITQPAKGKVSINTDGTITYISNYDISGTDAFTYEACNSQGYCGTATVSVTINPDGCGAGLYKANPSSGAVTKVFQNGFSGTNAATANSTSANFRDSWLSQTNATTNYGTATTAEVGKISERRGIFYFNVGEIPASAIIQSTMFSAYRSGGDTKTLSITAHSITNSWAVENQVSWTNRSTGPVVIWTTGGGDFGSTLATTSVTSTKKFYNWDIGNAVVQSWTSVPANNFGLLLRQNGTSLDKRHQFATKENGTAANRPKLTVTYIVPEPCSAIPNRDPLANPDYTTVMNGKSVVINPLTNDADVDAGNTLTITGVSAITAGSATFTGTAITYTANVNATVPRTEKLTYTVSDGNGGVDQAYVYIIVINAPPSANSDTISTNSGTLVTIPVIANDTDPEGGTITAPAISVKPKNGTAVVSGNSIDYTPVAGFTGKDTLIYQICETVSGSCSPETLCDTAMVIITVKNQAPVANPDTKSVRPCLSTTFNLIDNDTDPEGGALTVTIVTPPASGVLLNNNDGTVTYTPATPFVSPVSFTYTITDNGVTPIVSSPATVTINVTTPVNTPPVAVNDTETLNMDQTDYASVLDNDYDNELNPLSNPAITIAPLHGSAVVLANGLIQYTPNRGYYGTDSLTYQICETIFNPATCATSTGFCSTAVLVYSITAPNSVIAINDENSTWINTPVSGNILTNDFDPQGDVPLIFNGFIIGGLSYTSGVLSVSGIDTNGIFVADAGNLQINPDGTYTFTPANNFTGLVDVPYSIQDSNDNPAYDTANLRITVSPLPAAANSVIANNDENKAVINTPVSNSLFVNDFDPQGNLFNVTAYQYDTDGNGTADGTGSVGSSKIIGGITTAGTPVSNAGSLTINMDGTYTYIPATDFTGTIDVPYTITDILGATSKAVLHIDVLVDANGPQNDPPFAGDDFGYTNFNTVLNGDFVSNDNDPNGDPVSLNGTTIVPGGPHNPIGAPVVTQQGGSLQFYSDGTYLYTPPLNYAGPDKVNYTICDVTVINPHPLCATAMIHLLVGPGMGISGKVWIDADGDLTDPGAAESETNAGGNLYVNLIDNNGNVSATKSVSSDGSYSFNGVTPDASYSLILSTTQGTVGQPAPLPSLPSGWINTGTNLNGSLSVTTPGVIDAQLYGIANVINYNFGIEQLPNTDTYSTNIAQPVLNQFITLDGGANPPVVSGTDAEDCISGCTLSSRSVIFDEVPSNSELYYNGSLLHNGDTVKNMNPSLLKIKITTVSLGATSTSFKYSFMDNAGRRGMTPATYTISWLTPLPINAVLLKAGLSEDRVVLSWNILDESKLKYIEIERSSDGIYFEKIKSFNIKSTGNEYNFNDDIMNMAYDGMLFYRIKSYDVNSNYVYSNITSVKLKTIFVRVWPNPFINSINLRINSQINGMVYVHISDVAGKILLTQKKYLSAGLNLININGLGSLTQGTYLLKMVNVSSGKMNSVYKLSKIR